MTVKICVNEECGNCGWEMDTNEKRCGACRKLMVSAKEYYKRREQNE